MKTELSVAAPHVALLAALRHELKQYGEVLALLDQQQEYVLVRAADNVLQSVGAINAQMKNIQLARAEREQRQSEVAALLRPAGDPSFVHLIPLLPEPYRAAIGALVRENNDLLGRVQQRARQNHLLLCRSLEMMQQFINALLPAAPPKTYNGGGQLQPLNQPVQALYQAVG